MCLSRVRVSNFKSLRDVEIDIPTDLVALVGRNNSGKSALLDAILLSAESMQVTGQSNPPPVLSSRGEWTDLTFGKNSRTDPIIVELTAHGAADQLGIAIAPAAESPPADALSCTYRVEVRPDVMHRSVAMTFADGTDLAWPYEGPGQNSSQGNIQFDSSVFSESVGSVRHLAAERRVEPAMQASGGAVLADDGSNLIQVLNDLASSRGRVFDRIVRTASSIIPEMDDVLAGLQAGSNIAFGSIRETAFEDIEFRWPHLASGTRQVILIATFVHTTPRHSILLIEEPELYLHTESIWRLLDILYEQARMESKQIILTTHAPLIVERLSLEKSIIVARDRETGAATAQSLAQYSPIEPFLQKHGLLVPMLLLPNKGLRRLPLLLLIVEGQEDPDVWREFMKKAGLPHTKVNVEFVRNGGWAEASKAAGLLKLLSKLGIFDLPCLLVLEADENQDLKREKLADYGLAEDDYVILPLDVEAYLTNSAAIAAALGIPRAHVASVLRKVKGRPSKARLERIFESLGRRGLNSSKRRRLAKALTRLPADILVVTEHMRARLPEQ